MNERQRNKIARKSVTRGNKVGHNINIMWKLEMRHQTWWDNIRAIRLTWGHIWDDSELIEPWIPSAESCRRGEGTSHWTLEQNPWSLNSNFVCKEIRKECKRYFFKYQWEYFKLKTNPRHRKHLLVGIRWSNLKIAVFYIYLRTVQVPTMKIWEDPWTYFQYWIDNR